MSLKMGKLKKKIENRKKLTEEIKKVIIDRLKLKLFPEEIDDDEPLFGMGLGLDSVDALDLVLAVEGKFGVTIGEDDMQAFRSVNSIADYIEKQKEKND